MLTSHISAPHFTLPDEDGVSRSLSDYKGKWVLLYFYPKDDTPGCTVEACTIRDQFENFKQIDAVVLGVSADSVKSHKKFKLAYELPFTLLSDEKKEVVTLYDVWQKKKMMGVEYEGIVRASYLINPEGVIEKVYPKVTPKTHAQEVLADLALLKK